MKASIDSGRRHVNRRAGALRRNLLATMRGNFFGATILDAAVIRICQPADNPCARFIRGKAATPEARGHELAKGFGNPRRTRIAFDPALRATSVRVPP